MPFTSCQTTVLGLLDLVRGLLEIADTVTDVAVQRELLRWVVVVVRLLVTIVGP